MKTKDKLIIALILHITYGYYNLYKKHIKKIKEKI